MYDVRFIATLLMVLSLPVLGAWHRADDPQRFVVQPESRFWISGSSSVNRFTCETDQVAGYGVLRGTPSTIVTVQDSGVEPGLVHLTVPVQTFDCGNSRMNRDMYDALKAEAHPVIQYELLQACVLPAAEDGWHPVEARGTLTIAGVDRTVRMMLRGRLEADGRVRAIGQVDLQMTDFGIDPPSAMLGLIRAHDDITVHFELIAASAAAP